VQGASLAELRDLSRRSRRAQRRGLLGLLAVLLAVPAQLFLAPVLAAWAPLVVTSVGGIAFVAYAHAAGEERGAFRRVFRRLADERGSTRRVPVSEPSIVAAPQE